MEIVETDEGRERRLRLEKMTLQLKLSMLQSMASQAALFNSGEGAAYYEDLLCRIRDVEKDLKRKAPGTSG